MVYMCKYKNRVNKNTTLCKIAFLKEFRLSFIDFHSAVSHQMIVPRKFALPTVSILYFE